LFFTVKEIKVRPRTQDNFNPTKVMINILPLNKSVKAKYEDTETT